MGGFIIGCDICMVIGIIIWLIGLRLDSKRRNRGEPS